MRKFLLTLAVLLLTTVSYAAAKGPYLFQNGDALWKVTCRTQEDLDDPTIRYAAKELIRTLKIVSRAKKLDGADNANLVTLCLGVDSKLKEEEISIIYDGEKVQFSGGSPIATIHAVYYFLQKELGARWLWPGEDGEFIPQRDSYQVPADLNIRFVPSIRYRGFHMCGDWYKVNDFRDWMVRNFINIHRHGTHFKDDVRYFRMWSSHNVHLPSVSVEEHPEYFAEINGRRYTSQVCLNNSDVDQLIYEEFVHLLEKHNDLQILSIFPSDNQEYCQCVKCKEKGTSTSWFDFYNRLTDRLKEKFPHVKFATIAYQGYIAVPKNKVRNSIFVEYASYPRCNIHKYNDPNCPKNAKVYQAMKDWSATGVVMGDYGYEFDMFSGSGQPFTPFYSVIADTMKKTVDLKQVALITEVGLSPRNGPEYQTHYKDRLALYIYAQLMWDHTRKVEDLIKEWCELAYGKAAKPMYEYFMLLDKQWNALDIHFGILGNCLPIAPKLVTPEVKKKVAELFLEADKALGGQKCEALEFDKLLFSQWLKFLSGGENVTIPKLKDEAETPNGGEFEKLPGISAYWTEDALTINGLSKPFTLEFCAGFGGETWFFGVEKNGKQTTYRRSTVGVMERGWKVDWTFKNGKAVIPFKNLNLADSPSKWFIRFTVDGKTWPEADKEPAVLQFLTVNGGGVKVLWWTGTHSRDVNSFPKIRKDFVDNGWMPSFAEPGTDLTTLPKQQAYALINPTRKDNPLPEAQWEFLREQVKNGALLYVGAYSSPQLDRILNDPSFKITIRAPKSSILSERHSIDVYPGDWQKSPNKLTNGLKRGYTPAYFMEFAQPEAWRVLATMPEQGGENPPAVPYIAVRPYGKGIVLASSLELWLSKPGLMANVLANRDELLSGMDGTPAPAPAVKDNDDDKKKDRKNLKKKKTERRKKSRK